MESGLYRGRKLFSVLGGGGAKPARPTSILGGGGMQNAHTQMHAHTHTCMHAYSRMYMLLNVHIPYHAHTLVYMHAQARIHLHPDMKMIKIKASDLHCMKKQVGCF